MRAHLYPRLRRSADLQQVPSYAARPLPGIAELAAIDHPTHVTDLLSDEAVDQIGGWPEARVVAMTNLRALPAPHQDTILAEPDRDDSAVHVLTADDVFAPSRLLMLSEVLDRLGIETPSEGVLVAVPNQHLLALHPVSGAGVIAALQLLARIATGEHHDNLGALSPHVYYVPASGAPAEQVTSFADDGTLSIKVSGALAGTFLALGLLEG